jgi:hypothetical protein
MADLKRLRALIEAATPGPWRSKVNYYGGAFLCAGEHYGVEVADVCTRRGVGSQQACEANAALIAELRNAAPALLDAAERWAMLCEMADADPELRTFVGNAREVIEHKMREREERGRR